MEGTIQNVTGESCGARGYFISTVEGNEEVVRASIREHEKEEERYAPLSGLK
jgi:REP element-mobilizing transposase RayT